MTSTHFLPVPPLAFAEIAQGRQRAVCVPKASGWVEGDQVVLREQRPGDRGFTGAWTLRRVTGVLEGEGIADSHVVCSLSASQEVERELVALRRQVHLAESGGATVDRFFRQLERKQSARRELLRQNAERVASLRAERLRRASGAGGAP